MAFSQDDFLKVFVEEAVAPLHFENVFWRWKNPQSPMSRTW